MALKIAETNSAEILTTIGACPLPPPLKGLESASTYLETEKMLVPTITAVAGLVLAVGLGAGPASASSPAPQPSELECAEYYVVAEYPLADPPAATEYSDLLVGLNWGANVISAVPRADAKAAGESVIQFMRPLLPPVQTSLGAPQDYASMVQPLIDHYDASCRTYASLPPLDLKALQTSIDARLKAKGFVVR
jgi:hypothetical protein